MALLVSLFADFIQGEIEELDRILNILDPRSSTLDLPSLRQFIVERQSVAVAARESILKNGLVAIFCLPLLLLFLHVADVGGVPAAVLPRWIRSLAACVAVLILIRNL